MTKQNKADKVWAYLIKNPLATATEVAKATGVSYGYAHKLKSKVGTPKEVFEREAFENEVMRTDRLRSSRTTATRMERHVRAGR
jgi:hypothetical protein